MVSGGVSVAVNIVFFFNRFLCLRKATFNSDNDVVRAVLTFRRKKGDEK